MEDNLEQALALSQSISQTMKRIEEDLIKQIEKFYLFLATKDLVKEFNDWEIERRKEGKNE